MLLFLLFAYDREVIDELFSRFIIRDYNVWNAERVSTYNIYPVI